VSLWNTTHVYEVLYCVFKNVIHPLLWWRLSFSCDEIPIVVETASQFSLFAPKGTLLCIWIETVSATEPHWLWRHKKSCGLADSFIVIVESVKHYFTEWSYNNRVGCLKQNPLMVLQTYFIMRLLSVEQTIYLLHSYWWWWCQFCGAQSCSFPC
jgi:hypothetical protein